MLIFIYLFLLPSFFQSLNVANTVCVTTSVCTHHVTDLSCPSCYRLLAQNRFFATCYWLTCERITGDFIEIHRLLLCCCKKALGWGERGEQQLGKDEKRRMHIS